MSELDKNSLLYWWPSWIARPLRNGGINSIEQLLQKSEEQLLGFWQIGPVAIREIKQTLKERGLLLRKVEQ